MWILALCLLTTPPVGILVWYLRRRWQWWMLYAAKRMLRNTKLTVEERVSSGGGVFAWRGKGVMARYERNIVGARNESSLKVSYAVWIDGILYWDYFFFSAMGTPRWSWTRDNDTRDATVYLPKFARLILEDIWDLAWLQIEPHLNCSEGNKVAVKVGERVDYRPVSELVAS